MTIFPNPDLLATCGKVLTGSIVLLIFLSLATVCPGVWVHTQSLHRQPTSLTTFLKRGLYDLVVILVATAEYHMTSAIVQLLGTKTSPGRGASRFLS